MNNASAVRLVPSSATRRTFLSVSSGTLGTATLGLSGCGAKPHWAPHQLYKYTVRLEFDGQPYEFSNGGVLAQNLDKIHGDPYQDFPMPSAVDLGNSKTLVVFPPSLRGEWSATASKLSGRPLRYIDYSAGAFPSVFLFDNATTPQLVKGWLTRASVKFDNMRVRLLSVEAKVTGEDTRTPIPELPWYGPSHTAYRLFTDQEPLAAYKYQQANKSLFSWPTGSGFVPARALFAHVATIVPAADRDHSHLKGLDGPYAAIGQALAAGKPVHIPLRRSRVRDEPGLSWALDLHTFEFAPLSDKDLAWGLKNTIRAGNEPPTRTYFRAIAKNMTGLPLGPLTFIRVPKSYYDWQADNGAVSMSVGHLRLCLFETAVDGTAASAPESDFGLVLT